MGADIRAELDDAAEDVVFCARHPRIETVLRCGTCGTPICPRCLVQTPVGAKCPTCAKVSKLPTFNVTPVFFARAMTAEWDSILPKITHLDEEPWLGLRLSYDLSFGDYGGRANVDLRMQRFGDATAVIAGMYVDGFDGAQELDAIVATACWDSHAGECCKP